MTSTILNMKIAALVCILALVGCHAAPKPDAAVPVLHITVIDPCNDVSAMGTFRGREYELTRPLDAPLGVACYNPLGLGVLGKDYPATLDTDLGVFTIATPDGPVRYAIARGGVL